MSLENESLQYLVDSLRDEITTEQAAEFEQWLEKHYSMPADEFVENVMLAWKDGELQQDLKCVEHSLAKWQGAEAPGAHLSYRGHDIIAPQSSDPFNNVRLLSFDSGSCALCELQRKRCNSISDYCYGRPDGTVKPCPIVRALGQPCDDDGNNVYGLARDNPKLMIAVLDATKKHIEKEIIEANV